MDYIHQNNNNPNDTQLNYIHQKNICPNDNGRNDITQYNICKSNIQQNDDPRETFRIMAFGRMTNARMKFSQNIYHIYIFTFYPFQKSFVWKLFHAICQASFYLASFCWMSWSLLYGLRAFLFFFLSQKKKTRWISDSLEKKRLLQINVGATP